MSDKNKRMEWLNTLKGLQTKFNTGKRNLIGGSFTKVHDALSERVDEAILMLEAYLDDEQLSPEREHQVMDALENIFKAAGQYINKKAEKDKYALVAHDDVKEATGNNRDRLQAAQDLRNRAFEMREAIILAIEERNNQNRGPVPGREPMTLEALKELDKNSESVNVAASALHDAIKKFEVDKTAYDTSLPTKAWNAVRKNDIKRGVNLHLAKIMGFNTEQGFVDSYKKHRKTIYETVVNYRMLEKDLESEDENIRNEAIGHIHDLGMTVNKFKEMEDKVNELDMAGRYMDIRAELLQNPLYRKMTPKERENYYSMTPEEIRAERENPEKEELWNVLTDMAELKEMEKYGIKQAEKTTQKRFEMGKGAGKYGKMSTKGSALMGYVDTGKTTSAKTLKEYLSSKPITVNASDGTVITYDNRKFEKQQAGASINVIKAKGRIGKIGATLKSDSGNHVLKARVTGVTVKSGVGVSAAITNVDFVDMKLGINASIEAKGARGVIKGSTQTDNGKLKGDFTTEGQLGEAAAFGNLEIGNVTYKDSDGKWVNGIGVDVNYGIGAAAVTGTASGGITIFGVRFGGSVTGSLVSAGFYNSVGANAKQVNLGFNIGLGVFGIGLSFSVDWSGAVEKFRAWKKRKVARKELKQLRRAEKNADRRNNNQVNRRQQPGQQPRPRAATV